MVEVATGTVIAMAGVVKVATVEMLGRVQVRGGRPWFLGLPLSHPELDPRPTMNDLYKCQELNYNIKIDMHKIKNVRDILTK